MESTKHTWYGKQSHIFRTDGRVVRATLKQLVLERGAIYIKTEFVDNKGVLKTKDVSPITVASLQVLWENVDVVSDVELPDDVESVTDFLPPLESEHLPVLEVSFVQTPEMKCLLLQVNHFIGLPTPSSPNLQPVPMPAPLSRLRPRRARVSRHHRGRGTV
jgi:hypothetical protein